MAFAAVQDPDTAKELFAISGEHVVATAEGNSAKENPPCKPAVGQTGVPESKNLGGRGGPQG
jgi:hypothetical protein